MYAATGLEDIALLRFKLESLHKKVINIQEEEIQELVKFCFETCRLGFDKVGKQVQTYEQKVKQLEEERDHLLKECQYLKDIDEQGEHSKCILCV